MKMQSIYVVTVGILIHAWVAGGFLAPAFAVDGGVAAVVKLPKVARWKGAGSPAVVGSSSAVLNGNLETRRAENGCSSSRHR